MSNKVNRKTWAEFQETGLLLFVNTFLHIFGWSIVMETENKDGVHKVTSCFPARAPWRGFDHADSSEAYKNVSEYMLQNAEELKKEAEL